MKNIEPEVMRPIESICVIGPCKAEIGKLGVRHGKIGDVQIAWGMAIIAGSSAMAVVTETDTGEAKLSVNFSGAAR